jgi:hypothetical protein
MVSEHLVEQGVQLGFREKSDSNLVVVVNSYETDAFKGRKIERC